MLSSVPGWLPLLAEATGESEDELHAYDDYILKLTRERELYRKTQLKAELYELKQELLAEHPELKPKTSNLEITPEMIERAKNVDITDLIDHKRLWAICPFHGDTKPSLYLKNNFYHCFACGANGSVIDFVMNKYNVDFKTAVKVMQTL